MRGRVKLRMRLYHEQKFMCFYCKKRTPYYLFTLDHIIPKSRGGKNLHNNKVGACKTCNQMKMDLTKDEFMSCKTRKEAKRKHSEIQREKEKLKIATQR